MEELRFSRRTVIAAAEVMEDQLRTHAALTRQLLKLDSRLTERCNNGSLTDRFNHLIKFFDEDPSYRLDDGELLWDKFVETAVSLLRPPRERLTWDGTEEETQTPGAVFRHALERDGFAASDGILRRALPVDIGLPTTQSRLIGFSKNMASQCQRASLSRRLTHTRGVTGLVQTDNSVLSSKDFSMKLRHGLRHRGASRCMGWLQSDFSAVISKSATL
jgi:hypothetical protein